MKPQGMIWFNILRVVVPLGAIWSLFSPYSAIQGLSLFKAGSASTMFYSEPMYCCTYIICGIVSAVMGARLAVNLFRKSPRCANCARDVIIASTITHIATACADYATLPNYFSFGSVFIQLIVLYLIWVPTCGYLKKRF